MAFDKSLVLYLPVANSMWPCLLHSCSKCRLLLRVARFVTCQSTLEQYKLVEISHCAVPSKTGCLCDVVPTMLRDENVQKTGNLKCHFLIERCIETLTALKWSFCRLAVQHHTSINHVGVHALLSCCVKNSRYRLMFNRTSPFQIWSIGEAEGKLL
ncbi:hypothetical protein DAPPUDRAFT_109655 [Daphnia pulex]|uniref:Uncharacterized protein n=1 Tax=Daphnia pulex TaxID=6669 RepID=E9H3R5_DAPPU|nr:hypothetical protein DAPPUDRAFT_109655 [Daphnia pulex]|eukprot:EFX73563.1 hypothetical protein DAPPUDRAFT_109655 [Daphnia pulex]